MTTDFRPDAVPTVPPTETSQDPLGPTAGPPPPSPSPGQADRSQEGPSAPRASSTERRGHRPRSSGLGPRSLTGRLVAGLVALVVLLVVAIGASTFVLLRQFLYQRLDAQVAAVASGNVGSVASCLGRAHCELFTGGSTARGTLIQLPQREWLDVVTADGALLGRVQGGNGEVDQMHISAATAAAIVAAGGPRTVHTIDGYTLRVQSRQIGSSNAYVITGLSTDQVDESLRRLLMLEITIGAGAVVLALVAGFTGVSLGLKPLRRVTTTAREVTAELSPDGGGLDRRVPVDARNDTEVGQLATSVNTLLAAVEAQFAARVHSEERMREFLADASHELRTPLTSIRGFAELSRLQRRQAALHNGLDPAAAEDDALDRIESEGTRMSRLVDDLLLLARSDRGAPPSREPVEVLDMVRDVVHSAQVAHPDRRIDVQVSPGLTVLGDRDQLLRVVRNLVTNAAVHTAPGGPILVSAHADGEEIVIQVADSGPGLDPEQAAHVFERFWRADKARTRARGGSGLGMSIVATIVENHQGGVRFDSTPESGSTVTVVLPAAPPQA